MNHRLAFHAPKRDELLEVTSREGVRRESLRNCRYPGDQRREVEHLLYINRTNGPFAQASRGCHPIATSSRSNTRVGIPYVQNLFSNELLKKRESAMNCLHFS